MSRERLVGFSKKACNVFPTTSRRDVSKFPQKFGDMGEVYGNSTRVSMEVILTG